MENVFQSLIDLLGRKFRLSWVQWLLLVIPWTVWSNSTSIFGGQTAAIPPACWTELFGHYFSPALLLFKLFLWICPSRPRFPFAVRGNQSDKGRVRLLCTDTLVLESLHKGSLKQVLCVVVLIAIYKQISFHKIQFISSKLQCLNPHFLNWCIYHQVFSFFFS